MFLLTGCLQESNQHRQGVEFRMIESYIIQHPE